MVAVVNACILPFTDVCYLQTMMKLIIHQLLYAMSPLNYFSW